MTERSVSYNSRYILREKLKQRCLPHFSVYRATQEGLERDVEIRIFKVKSNDEESTAIKRFTREYKILATLDHPNIIKILDLGSEKNSAYYVTDLRDAKSISELQSEGKTFFGTSDVLKIGREIGKALSYIHKRGLLHRDISIDNTFFDENNDFYYIGSFSQGKELIDKDVTSRGVPFISPLIATPEILQNLPIDNRTDIYILGKMMYQLLTAKKDLSHYNAFEIETLDVTSLDVRPILEYNSQVPASVDKLIRKMICIEPDKRFKNFDEFLTKLDFVQRKIENIQTLRFTQQQIMEQIAKKNHVPEVETEEDEDQIPEDGRDKAVVADSDIPPSPTIRDYLDLLPELPKSLKFGLLLSLLPLIGIAIFLLSSGSASDQGYITQRAPLAIKRSPTTVKSGGAQLPEILAFSSKTTKENFHQRYDLIAKYRRSFPHKDRKNIVSYNELIEARVAFYSNAPAGCKIIDKVIQSLKDRNQ